MNRISRFLAAASLLFSFAALAAQGFVVRDIRVEGLQRISAGTVFNYLPVKVGEEFSEDRFQEAIRALFKTGYFSDVRLERDGQILVVAVQERPTISEIRFEGNKDFNADELKTSLKDIGFASGRVYDKSTLDRVEQELKRQYFAQGKYAVQIKPTVTPLERNRVDILFDIAEGLVARIKEINLVGNEAFTDAQILEEFQLTTPTYFSFFTKDDQYSKQKLAADLESLSKYYQNRGYINFQVTSTQVTITPDKKDIYITINVAEGKPYTIKDVKIAGRLMVPDEALFKAVKVRSGDTFSRREVSDSQNALTELLGTEGYAFANINAIPEMDEKSQQVSLTFQVDPGARAYVRRVNFAGNIRTRDEVLRREMRQLEGGWFSTAQVKRSRERLEKLGYFKEVNVETPAVPGSPDQVDVNVNVAENPSGLLLAGVGYSQSGGFIINANVTQENFLGTGKRVGVGFSNSDVDRNYSFSYTNPYWTVDGVSRSFGVHYRERDASQLNISNYTTDTAGANVGFGVPISETNSVNFGLAYDNIDLKLGTTASAEIAGYVARRGNQLNTLTATVGWAQDARNRHLLADRGHYLRLGSELGVPGTDMEYISVSGQAQGFFPLSREFTLMLNSELSWGDGYGKESDMPFLQHYFAGGPRSVRGFKDNTLGPLDSSGNPFGGDFRAVANAEVLFPVPFLHKDSKSMRMLAFVDAGNVFAEPKNFKLGDIRSSAGLGFQWISPFGPLSFSLAQPINDKAGDQTQRFQFLLGAAF